MNYTTLKADIADWIARSDLSSSVVDSIIDLAEARINRKLRIRAMETVYFRSLDSDAKAAVPTGYRQWKGTFLYKGTPDTEDTFNALANTLVSPLKAGDLSGAAADFKNSSTSGQYVSRIGSNFYVHGKPSGTYSLGGIYYAGFTALDADNLTNWLTDNAPDLLLSGTLFEASTYIKSESEMQFWATRFGALIDDVQAESDRELWAGEQIVTRTGVIE